MLGIATMASAGQVVPSYACSDRNPVAAGYFCKNSTKLDCRPGCYCEGGGNVNSTIDLSTSCEKRYGDEVNQFNGVHLCPKDFPKSAANATSMFECYNEKFGRIIYRSEYFTCPPGSYLKKDTIDCASCKDKDDLESDQYCPGITYGTAVYSSSQDQGIHTCPSGYTPTADLKSCGGKPVSCIPGSYMPANSQQCTPCPNGYVCLGGNYEVDYPTDQGKLLPKDACTSEHGFDDEHYVANGYGDRCDKCPIGTKANADHTECVETSIKVTKGYYLPANSVQQQKCSNPKKFCPGGEFWKSSVEQGQYDCPLTGTSASSNYQRCTVTLSGEQLQFGVMGDNGSQCWSKTDPEDFQYCVLGLRGIKTMDIKGLRDTIQQNIRNNGLQTAVFIGNQQTN